MAYFGTRLNTISSILSKLNISMAFRSENKLSIQICNSEDVTNKNKKSRNWKLTCSDCNITYLGQTVRHLTTV